MARRATCEQIDCLATRQFKRPKQTLGRNDTDIRLVKLHVRVVGPVSCSGVRILFDRGKHVETGCTKTAGEPAAAREQIDRCEPPLGRLSPASTASTSALLAHALAQFIDSTVESFLLQKRDQFLTRERRRNTLSVFPATDRRPAHTNRPGELFLRNVP